MVAVGRRRSCEVERRLFRVDPEQAINPEHQETPDSIEFVPGVPGVPGISVRG